MKGTTMKLAFVLLIALGAAAEAADFSAKILDFNNKPVIDDAVCPADTSGKRPCATEVTLGDVSVRALMAVAPDEQNLAGEEKFKRFVLAMKIKDGGEVALSAEDIALLKKLIGKIYAPLVVGRAFPLLDPGEKKP
jgi:hypothetical protein